MHPTLVPFRLTRLRTGGLMVGYGLGFLMMHRLAAYWGEGSSFSLWFPAAGLRFAVLWIFGPAFAGAVTATELVAQALTGVLAGPDWWLTAIGITSSSLSYAVAIALVRHCLRHGRGSLPTPPMSVGFAMLLCPLIAALGSLPWGLFAALNGPRSARWPHILEEMGTFWIGDLLGILTIAPPLLWLADRKFVLARPRLSARQVEAAGVVIGGCVVSGLVWVISGVVHIEPMLLCAVWVGLRLGRMAAWVVSALVALMVLMMAGIDMPLERRANLHLLAICVAITSYLVGSYAEAEALMRHDLKRQERLLLQADRLKTLRAMSVAVIHDISQPLSTLNIEARYLGELASAHDLDRKELAATSTLIERKAGHLAELVQRMRLFGVDRADVIEAIAVDGLMREVLALVKAEADATKTILQITDLSPATVMGQEVELQQALVNLVRNAIAAAPGGIVSIGAVSDDEVYLRVCDNGTGTTSSRGMGLGLIIARTIAEAHGGRLYLEALEPHGSCYALVLPRAASRGS